MRSKNAREGERINGACMEKRSVADGSLKKRFRSITGISEASVQLQLPKLAPLIRAGGKVELRCHVDGSGDLKYEWFR
jgi:hypothetical protein